MANEWEKSYSSEIVAGMIDAPVLSALSLAVGINGAAETGNTQDFIVLIWHMN